MPKGHNMNPTLDQTRIVLDQLRAAGLTEKDICHRLRLWEIKENPRALRHMYAGRTNMRLVLYRALQHLLLEVNSNAKTNK